MNIKFHEIWHCVIFLSLSRLNLQNWGIQFLPISLGAQWSGWAFFLFLVLSFFVSFFLSFFPSEPGIQSEGTELSTPFYHMSLWTWNQNGNDLTNSYAQWFRTQLERFWFTVRCWMTKFMCQSTCIRSISQRFHCHCSGSLLIVVFVAVVFLSISSPLALPWTFFWLISMTSKGYSGHCILF